MEFVGKELLLFHFIFSILLFFPPIVNLLSLFLAKSHTKKLKSMAVMAPAYYTILSASLLSGFVIWAMLGFAFLLPVYLMLFSWVYALVFEIKRHKKQKIAKREPSENLRNAFFQWARFKYALDLALFCLIYLLEI